MFGRKSFGRKSFGRKCFCPKHFRPKKNDDKSSWGGPEPPQTPPRQAGGAKPPQTLPRQAGGALPPQTPLLKLKFSAGNCLAEKLSAEKFAGRKFLGRTKFLPNCFWPKTSPSVRRPWSVRRSSVRPSVAVGIRKVFGSVSTSL